MRRWTFISMLGVCTTASACSARDPEQIVWIWRATIVGLLAMLLLAFTALLIGQARSAIISGLLLAATLFFIVTNRNADCGVSSWLMTLLATSAALGTFAWDTFRRKNSRAG